MCIRDSEVGLHVADGLSEPGRGERRNGRTDHAHTEDSVGAVSYTHLRAHETVLDLVCRLLLEKKKTN